MKKRQLFGNAGLAVAESPEPYYSDAATAPQLVYLDFDGAETDYRGELLKLSDVTISDSGLTGARIETILTEVRNAFDENVIFVTAEPVEGTPYSTIFVGQTDAFDAYGKFLGLSETVDAGNRIADDNAFVLADASDSDAEISFRIIHETGHLLGASHEGEGLDAYALVENELILTEGTTRTGLQIGSADGNDCRLLQFQGAATATDTTINADGIMTVFYAGAVADGVTINGEGTLNVSYGTIRSVVVRYGGIFNLSPSFDGMYVENLTIEAGGTLNASYYYNVLRGEIRVAGTFSAAAGSVVTVTGGTFFFDFTGNEAPQVNALPTLGDGGAFALLLPASPAGSFQLAADAKGFSGGVEVYAGGVLLGTVATERKLVDQPAGITYKLTSGSAVPLTFSVGGLEAIRVGDETAGGDVATLLVDTGQEAFRTVVVHGGALEVRGSTHDTTLFSGSETVYAGGSADSTNVTGSGLQVIDGGTAVGSIAEQTGKILLKSGSATNATIRSGGTLEQSGGTLTTLTVGNESAPATTDSFFLLSAGSAEAVTVASDGSFLQTGGAASGVVLHAGATLNADTDCVLSATNAEGDSLTITDRKLSGTVGSGTTVSVKDGGSSEATIVNSGGTVNVTGGNAAGIVINSGGTLNVTGGNATGTVNGTIVLNGGTFGGVLNSGSTAVLSSGTLDGATLKGFVNFNNTEASVRLANLTVAGGNLGCYSVQNLTIGGFWTIDAAARSILNLNSQSSSATTVIEEGTSFRIDLAGRSAAMGKQAVISARDAALSEIAYTVTMAAGQTGNYNLFLGFAEGDFTGTVHLLVAGDETFSGTFQMTADGYNTLQSGDTVYTLNYDPTLRTISLKAVEYREIAVETGGTIHLTADDAEYGSATGGKLTAGQSYSGATIFGGTSSAAPTSAGGAEVNLRFDGGELADRSILYGGNDGSTAAVGQVNLEINSGTVGHYAFGGGRNSGTNNVNIAVNGGTIHNLIGAGHASDGNSIYTTSTRITLDGTAVRQASNSSIFGGGYAAGGTATTYNAAIDLKDGTYGYLYGGGYAYGAGSTVRENAVSLTISGGTCEGYLYGGGHAYGTGSSSSVTGTAAITISGGTFRNYIFGGGYACGGSDSVNTSVITISGGSFARSIYAGGQVSSAAGGSSYVTNATIRIDAGSGTAIDFSAGAGIWLDGSGDAVAGASADGGRGALRLELTGNGANLRTDGGSFRNRLGGNGGTLFCVDFVSSDFQAAVDGFGAVEFGGSTAVVHTGTATFAAGTDYTFDLTGRSAAASAFWSGGSGSFGIDADSEFTVKLTSADLAASGGNSGGWLLLDGEAGAFELGETNNFNLVFDQQSSTGWTAGESWNTLVDSGYDFRLLCDAAGELRLEWRSAAADAGTFTFEKESNSSGWLA